MITDEQRQQYKLKGYDIVFERNNRVFAVNSTNVKNWNSDKQEKFCDATRLKLFTEEDGNPVFYDSDYFEVTTGSVDFPYLHYKALKESKIPQPINCHTMQNMFANRDSLQSLDLSNWDVSNVKDMLFMFFNCISLRSLNISNWDVSNVRYMQFIFYNCDSLQSLDLSNWDVSNAINMFGMFDNCDSLIKTYGKSADELQNALINNQWPTLPNQGIKSSKTLLSKIRF